MSAKQRAGRERAALCTSAWISGPRRLDSTPRMEVPSRDSHSRSCRAVSWRVSSISCAARAARSAVMVPAATLS